MAQWVKIAASTLWKDAQHKSQAADGQMMMMIVMVMTLAATSKSNQKQEQSKSPKNKRDNGRRTRSSVCKSVS